MRYPNYKQTIISTKDVSVDHSFSVNGNVLHANQRTFFNTMKNVRYSKLLTISLVFAENKFGESVLKVYQNKEGVFRQTKISYSLLAYLKFFLANEEYVETFLKLADDHFGVKPFPSEKIEKFIFRLSTDNPVWFFDINDFLNVDELSLNPIFRRDLDVKQFLKNVLFKEKNLEQKLDVVTNFSAPQMFLFTQFYKRLGYDETVDILLSKLKTNSFAMLDRRYVLFASKMLSEVISYYDDESLPKLLTYLCSIPANFKPGTETNFWRELVLTHCISTKVLTFGPLNTGAKNMRKISEENVKKVFTENGLEEFLSLVSAPYVKTFSHGAYVRYSYGYYQSFEGNSVEKLVRRLKRSSSKYLIAHHIEPTEQNIQKILWVHHVMSSQYYSPIKLRKSLFLIQHNVSTKILREFLKDDISYQECLKRIDGVVKVPKKDLTDTYKKFKARNIFDKKNWK